ncbi:MAG: hypothetical protein KGN35_08275 [Betaproteobacteria bacterium]|nr:hypothetical protein [Betaproteobacteria bacterium]
MKILKFMGLLLLGMFALTLLIGTYAAGKVILVDRYPEKSFLSKNTIEPEDIVNPNLTKDNVSITIGTEAIQLTNPAYILIEDKDGKVTRISAIELKVSSNNDKSQNVVGDNSLQELLLQAVTASSNAFAGWRCTGPYVNSNGEVVPRSCQLI